MLYVEIESVYGGTTTGLVSRELWFDYLMDALEGDVTVEHYSVSEWTGDAR